MSFIKDINVMTFALPTILDLHNTDADACPGNPRFIANIGSVPTGTIIQKNGGNLPINWAPCCCPCGQASQWHGVTNTVAGLAWEFQACQAGYDVSCDTRVMLWHIQHNAPNRIQLNTLANGGERLRIYSGSGSPPTAYKEYYLGGNDSPMAEALKGSVPFAIDLNDTSNEASSGCFLNCDVTSYSFLTNALALFGSNSNWNYHTKLYMAQTIKTGPCTPTFSGTCSNFCDAVLLVQGTTYQDKFGNWVRQSGCAIFIDMPWRIGNNGPCCSITTFNDGGKTIISPVSDCPSDPRNRFTTQAMRTYLNLRNNCCDTATFSGTYVWGTRAPFCWVQTDSAIVTFSGPSFKGMGAFSIGDSITGPATFDDVDLVDIETGTNIDGSTFKNPNGCHLLNLGGPMTITGMRFETYCCNHAILIDTAGTYTFDNVFFDQSGTNDVENTSCGAVTITVSNCGTTPTVTNTGACSTTTIVVSKAFIFNCLQPCTEVRFYCAGTQDTFCCICGTINGVDCSTCMFTFTFNPSDSPCMSVDITIHNICYNIIKFKATAICCNQSFTIQQIFDRNFDDPC